MDDGWMDEWMDGCMMGIIYYLTTIILGNAVEMAYKLCETTCKACEKFTQNKLLLFELTT